MRCAGLFARGWRFGVAFRVYAIQLTFFACTRFCVLGAISRVRNRTSLHTKHAVSGQGRSFACTQCCRRGLHARETIPGLAFRVYVMLRLFFAYMRFYTYTDISRACNSLSLFCMHAVLYPESLFACLQYILAASSAREHVSKPRFRVFAMLPPVFAYTRNYSRAGIPRARKPSCPPLVHARLRLNRGFACTQIFTGTSCTRVLFPRSSSRVYVKPNHRRQIKTTYIICQKKSTYYKNLRKKIEKSGFFNKKDSKKKRIDPKRTHTEISSQPTTRISPYHKPFAQ